MAGTIVADAWQNGDGTQNYKCRAWANFNGTTTPLTIRASGNVSSITDNGVGDYTVNFAIAMTDLNYATITTVGGVTTFNNDTDAFATSPATNSIRLNLQNENDTWSDLDYICLAIFR